MNRRRIILAVSIALVLAAIVGGVVWQWRADHARHDHAEAAVYYCPSRPSACSSHSPARIIRIIASRKHPWPSVR